MDEPLHDAEFCYVTTVGRRTGRPHTIEIWFAARGGTLYLLAGDPGSDWVRNLRREPAVRVRVGDGPERPAVARVVDDPEEDALARRLLAARYQGWTEGQPMSSWAARALPVAIRFTDEGGFE